jgi:hypothetical protein
MLQRIPSKSHASNAKQYAYIQEETNVPDGEGGNVVTWSNVSSLIAMVITPINAVRKSELRSFNVDATHYIRIRGLIPFSELNRIFYHDNINNVDRIYRVSSGEDIQMQGVETFIVAIEERL